MSKHKFFVMRVCVRTQMHIHISFVKYTQAVPVLLCIL